MIKLQTFALPPAGVLALGLAACEPQNGGTTTTDPALTAPGAVDPPYPTYRNAGRAGYTGDDSLNASASEAHGESARGLR